MENYDKITFFEYEHKFNSLFLKAKKHNINIMFSVNGLMQMRIVGGVWHARISHSKDLIFIECLKSYPWRQGIIGFLPGVQEKNIILHTNDIAIEGHYELTDLELKISSQIIQKVQDGTHEVCLSHQINRPIARQITRIIDTKGYMIRNNRCLVMNCI